MKPSSLNIWSAGKFKIFTRTREKQSFGERIFELRNWSGYDPKLGRNVIKNVNLYVKKGEIVGIAGLMGSGRTELALSIFGNAKNYKLNSELIFEGSKTNL